VAGAPVGAAVGDGLGRFFSRAQLVTTFLMEERSTEWAVPRCLGFADVSHLYAAGCRSSGGTEGELL